MKTLIFRSSITKIEQRNMASKIFLDANVILDYVLKRKNYDKIRYLFELESKSRIKFYMSSSIVHITGYFLTKYIGSSMAKTTILKLLNNIQVVDGSHDTAVLAMQSENPDIEDALQYEIAIKNKMDYYLSSDKKLIKYSIIKLPIITIPEAGNLF